MANSRTCRRLLAWLAAVALVPFSLKAQDAVSRAAFGAGGGTASGGVYTVTDTIGESPSGAALANNDAVTDGFWGTFGSVPEPAAFNLTARANGAAGFFASELLVGAYADGEPVFLTSVDAASANGGSVTLTQGRITYLPLTNYGGADSFHYTITDDEGDSAVGVVSVTVIPTTYTVTSVADNGPGTLREGVTMFNNLTDQTIVFHINFAANLRGRTIVLTNAGDATFGASALVVSNRLTIDAGAAPGVTVSAGAPGSPMRLIFVPSGSQLTVNNLTLAGGEALGGTGGVGGGGGGGAAGFGGGILNEGSLTLSNVTLAGNQAVGGVGGAGTAGAPGAPGTPSYGGFGAGAGGGGTCGGGGGLGAGGAIFNYGGVAYLTNCVLRGNSATEGAGGAGLGGVCDGVSGGPSLGGGIVNYNGYVYLTGCALTNNTAAVGGGLCNYGDAAASWVYLTGNNLTNNASTNDFASLSANGGDAQTVEGANTIDSQDALWFSPIADIGTFQTNHPVTVTVTLNIPTNVSAVFTPQATSSDVAVVAATNLAFSGSAGNYTLRVTPTASQAGSSLITVFADGAGLSAQTTFTATFGLFLTVTITPGGPLLTVITDPGATCTAQYKNDLSTATWNVLGNLTEVAPGKYQILDATATGAERFYQVAIP